MDITAIWGDETRQFPGISALAARLQKPVCVFDVETTGFIRSGSPPGIVEIAYAQIFADGDVDVYEALVNPQCPIPSGATAIHGISEQHVASCDPFWAHADRVHAVLQMSVISGFRSRMFDVEVIHLHLRRLNLQVEGLAHLDVRDVWRGLHDTGSQRGRLADVARFYGVETGQAHRAGGDVLTTANILEAMVQVHGVSQVSKFLQ